ncbi:MAG: flavodoxin family protein [Deltaproteobacteria bacterium]|jgi:multimeric flavodoxin WrbA|nr:flavodoxin family protein [Deltaproteobacteria bacterium]
MPYAPRTDPPLVVGLNGSPRKSWNTASLVAKALEGAQSVGAQTELIHLYDLSYKGCASCFACKKKKTYLNGKCALKDDLSPVLERLETAQGVIMGSPIYLGDVTAATRAFWERYIFINLAYDGEKPSVLSRGPFAGVIYAMNIPADLIETFEYDALLRLHKGFLARLNGPGVETLLACDTLQFSDYSQYHAPMFSEEKKKKVRETDFPLALREAFAMGARFGARSEA